VSVKIDVTPVVTEHYATLVRESAGKRANGTRPRSWTDLVTFWGLPCLVVALVEWRAMTFATDTVSAVITSLSILAGLLFNLLVLLYQGTEAEKSPATALRRRVKYEIFINIAYAIIVALVALVPWLVVINKPTEASTAAHVSRALAVWLSTHFTLTLMMVLKRMYNLLHERFEP
jgi:hypothetical protein